MFHIFTSLLVFLSGVSVFATSWNIVPDSDINQHYSCDLQRLHIDDFLPLSDGGSNNDLMKRLHAINGPVVIEGALSKWTALEKWQNKTYFLEKFGHTLVPRNAVVNSSLIVSQGHPNGNILYDGYTLNHFVDVMATPVRPHWYYKGLAPKASPGPMKENIDSNHNPYNRPFLFQKERLSLSIVTDLAEDLETDSHTSSDAIFTSFLPPSLESLNINYWKILSIGGEHGGLPLHKHSASWLGLIFGAKKWSFLPPAALSIDAFTASAKEDKSSSLDMYTQAALNSPSLWSDELRALLKGNSHDVGSKNKSGSASVHGLLECTQLPSEVIYVPNNWWHATDNIGDSIAIGAQAKSLYSPSMFSINRPNDEIEWPYAECALAVSDLCANVELHSSAGKGISKNVRKAIQDIITASPNEKYRALGGTGLIVENGIEFCNDVAHRLIQKKATYLEPLNIIHIISYATAIYKYPIEHLSDEQKWSRLHYDPILSSVSDPIVLVSRFIQGKVQKVYSQYKMSHISKLDTIGFVSLMGKFLSTMPADALAALACPNTPMATNCGIWTDKTLRSEQSCMVTVEAVKNIYIKLGGNTNHKEL
jgi:hypothetical protein